MDMERLYTCAWSQLFFLNGWQKICWVFIRRKRNSRNKTKYNRKQLRSWKQHRQLSATKNTNTGNKNNCNSKEKQNYDFVASWYCWKSSLIRKATSSKDLSAWLKVFRYRWWSRLWRGKGYALTTFLGVDDFFIPNVAALHGTVLSFEVYMHGKSHILLLIIFFRGRHVAVIKSS